MVTDDDATDDEGSGGRWERRRTRLKASLQYEASLSTNGRRSSHRTTNGRGESVVDSG